MKTLSKSPYVSGRPAGTPLLQVAHLSLDLPTERGWVSILDDVSFEIRAGELLGLAGESGSGKTMTALAIMGLLPSRTAKISGTVVFDGIDLLTLSPKEMRSVRGKAISMVFQEPITSLHPAFTVGEQIAEVVRAHEKVGKKAAWARAVDMLDRVGIANPVVRSKQYAFQFSGGMQQRVMMAMSLVCHPKLLIADEPTTALDVTVQAQITELIKELQRDLDMAVLFVTHDLGVLAGIAQRMVVMYGGQIVEVAMTRDMFVSPKHPYTQALILAAPHPDLKGQRLPTIPGAPPHPARLPVGCRFHPRCAYCTHDCTTGYIAIESPTPGRQVRCVRHEELQLLVDIEKVMQ
jgi:peptide/nickel transport system ATP-binding protein